jgi:phospholipid-binding lipoprotein MlaA
MLENARLLKFVFALVPLLSVASCATPPSDPEARAQFEATNDPLEPVNRDIFAFNQFFDRVLFKPLAKGYRTVVPEFGRDAIRHFLDNLGEPVVFANNVMQGQFRRADHSAGRFIINSVAGVGGIFDVATRSGLEPESGDFGQTLYSWGVPDGPYLVLPILGPSNPRDAIGMGVGAYMDPFSYLAADYGAEVATYSRWAATGIDERSRHIEDLDELQRNALDFYAELRSLFRQHRSSELRHGEPAPAPDMDSFAPDSTPQK